MAEKSKKVNSDKAVSEQQVVKQYLADRDTKPKNVILMDFSAEYIRLKKYKADEGGLAEAWQEKNGNIWLFVTGVERWYFWTGKYWKLDDNRNAERDMIVFLDTVNTIAGDAIKTAKATGNGVEEKIAESYHALTKVSAARITSVLEVAKNGKSMPISEVNKGNLLNLANGTLNLDTFELQAHNPDDFIDYCMSYPYDPSATSPNWDYFKQSALVKRPKHGADDTPIWEHSADMALLLEELMGIGITNETKHEKMLFLHGGGGNGKSTIIHVLTKLVDPFSVNVDFDTLGQSGNYDLAKLPGKRVAFATEANGRGSLIEKYLKMLVSNKPVIPARPIHGKPFEFESMVKIFWAMNETPRVLSTNDGTWRRLIFMPLYRHFDDNTKDKTLWDKLESELPGILNQLIDAIKRVNKSGFTTCQTCEDAKQEYKAESSSVVWWRRECCNDAKSPKDGQFGKSLWEHYEKWCTENKRQPVGQTRFFSDLKNMVKNSRSENGVKYALNIKDDHLATYDASSLNVPDDKAEIHSLTNIWGQK